MWWLPMSESEFAVVRAIDVGYSMTKYTVSQDPRECASFPSIATPASERELGIGRRGKRNTVTVPVEGQRFELGPDARLAVGAVDVRP